MLRYNVIDENEAIMVLPEGELIYHVHEELEDTLSRHMVPGALLSFNMGNVSFVDSAGVGFLVQMKNLAERWNGSFEIRHLQRRVKLVLDKLALTEFLNVA